MSTENPRRPQDQSADAGTTPAAGSPSLEMPALNPVLGDDGEILSAQEGATPPYGNGSPGGADSDARAAAAQASRSAQNTPAYGAARPGQPAGSTPPYGAGPGVPAPSRTASGNHAAPSGSSAPSAPSAGRHTGDPLARTSSPGRASGPAVANSEQAAVGPDGQPVEDTAVRRRSLFTAAEPEAAQVAQAAQTVQPAQPAQQQSQAAAPQSQPGATRFQGAQAQPQPQGQAGQAGQQQGQPGRATSADVAVGPAGPVGPAAVPGEAASTAPAAPATGPQGEAGADGEAALATAAAGAQEPAARPATRVERRRAAQKGRQGEQDGNEDVPLDGSTVVGRPKSRAAAHWLGVLVSILALPVAWYFLNDGASTVSEPPTDYAFGPSLRSLLELTVGAVALLIALWTARRSSVGSITVGVISILINLPFLVVPAAMTRSVSPFLAGLSEQSALGRSLSTYLWTDAVTGKFLALGLFMVMVGAISHSARRAGRREQEVIDRVHRSTPE